MIAWSTSSFSDTLSWAASSYSSDVNWLPLTSIVSSVDSTGVNFLVVASEHDPTLAVSDFRAAIATEFQITNP